MELFDLVNSTDNVIGVTDKHTAHANGHLHRSAAVFVFNRRGQLYVQVHKSSGGLYDHSVGGHVSRGETYTEAAHREAVEELGLDQPLKQLTTIYSDEGCMQHMFTLFTCIADSSWQFIPNDEVEEIILMTIPQITSLMTTTPEKFRRGFINTMWEYQRIRRLTLVA